MTTQPDTPAVPEGPFTDPPAGFYLTTAQYNALADTLTAAGVELGEYERGIAAWLSSWEWSTVAVIASWVARAAVGREPAPAVSLPGRFDATPADVDQHLRRILAEDTYLRYQQAIGGQAVTEAAADVRVEVVNPGSPDAKAWRAAADFIDPALHSGPYPSQLQCSQHDGFGPCPGAPRCTPRDLAAATAYGTESR
ncbi:MAG TPA: hypothetical protein VFH77_17485 [Streptomyces sp.]|nr:hypothetical protein [Streptomyces sp.]